MILAGFGWFHVLVTTLNFISLAGKFLVCLAGKKEQIIFSQQY